MNKSITLLTCSLLLASSQTLADRPAMSERSGSIDSEMIDINIDLEDTPIFEEVPTEELPSALETPPEMEEISDIEELEVEVVVEPQLEDVEPAAQVLDNITETEVIGDISEIQAGETLPVKLLDFPRRGMTMDKVRNELGEPVNISDTVGEPPITTWTYNDRVIYFEYSNVVHVVVTH